MGARQPRRDVLQRGRVVWGLACKCRGSRRGTFPRQVIMAERIQVELVDDIDGSEAQQTVTFALDGVAYEIDLNEQHARQLRSVFARYVEQARTPERQTPRTTRQQEREQRRERQTNRQLTEQIRGAAQRSRERLNKSQDEAEQQPAEAEQQQEQQEEPILLTREATAEAAPEATSETDSEEDAADRHAPAVSLPQFSAAE